MTEQAKPRLRAEQRWIVDRNRAVRLIREFTDRAGGFHARAAALRGYGLSRHGDIKRASVEAAHLRKEVQAVHGEFRKAVHGQPKHTRIDDLDMTFRRLIALLS